MRLRCRNSGFIPDMIEDKRLIAPEPHPTSITASVRMGHHLAATP
jgi:hypothetical protein